MRNRATLALSVRLASLGVTVAALVLLLLGLSGPATVAVVGGVVLQLLAEAVRPRTAERVGPVPPIEPDEVPRIQRERAARGEVAAVKLLREERPDLSLVEAVALVRGL